jgi:hypothetical protein
MKVNAMTGEKLSIYDKKNRWTHLHTLEVLSLKMVAGMKMYEVESEKPMELLFNCTLYGEIETSPKGLNSNLQYHVK